MNKKVILLLMLILICFQRCDEPVQKITSSSTNSDDIIIDPIPLYCYEVNEGKAFDNPLVLNKGYSGRVAVSTEIDTLNLRLVNIRIIKTLLKDHRNSSNYAEFQNTDFDKKPEYPKELLDILPLIEQYLDTVKVTKINRTSDCVKSISYSMLVKIE